MIACAVDFNFMNNLAERSRPGRRARPSGQPAVGNYQVAVYPPVTAWEMKQAPVFEQALLRPARSAPLGLYVHFPFCQKKCDFCYYLSYAGQGPAAIQKYLEMVVREAAGYSRRPAIKGRPVRSVYFGGGTPSLLTSAQLHFLADGLRGALPWEGVEEITFECAPRSVGPELLEALREVGVTRLSLGAESFDDRLLEFNGRIHLRGDILRAYEQMQQARFNWVNLDLMAGMPGEEAGSWRETVAEAIALSPESVTVYQTEIPRNTQTYRNVEAGQSAELLPEWDSKRCRVCYAFNELEHAGYAMVNAYMAVKEPAGHRFVHQEHLWRGGDLLGLGVASIGYVGGFHYQNKVTLDSYMASVADGRQPLKRAFKLGQRSKIAREFILQMKTGVVATGDFARKFGVDIIRLFERPLQRMAEEGLLVFDRDQVRLTRAGLYRVDLLLPEFYEKPFRELRAA
jgi:oxygen-independent coproporphyrinogen-3 oxidase